MAVPTDPIVRVEGLSAISGPASINSTLLDAVSVANYEGVWAPWLFVKQGSLEVSGTFATLSCQLFGTNQINPLNSYAITIAGSFTAADIITLNFTTPLGVLAATYTVSGGDTATVAAAGLKNFINTSSAFSAQGFQASNVAGVLTVTWPTPPFLGAGSYSTSNPAYSPIVTVTSSVSGSATETVAVAAGSGGSALGSAITASGMTQFTLSARWLKVRITTLTGGNVTAIAQGTA